MIIIKFCVTGHVIGQVLQAMLLVNGNTFTRCPYALRGAQAFVQYICVLHFHCRYVDDHSESYIQRLSDAVAIQSVSSWPEKRSEVVRMVKVVAKVLFL